ncbi:MAG: hypothetical protein FWF51_08350 [Chitinivibrionia bacterium]|nr:hypothetical protein [Chitinivibrionia bacterium]
MKNCKISKIFLLLFSFFAFSFADKIIDPKNILDSSLVSYWNNALSIIEDECSANVVVLIFANDSEISNSQALSPTISIIYDSISGFEIYQNDFGNDNHFIIPSSFISNIIPEANEKLKIGETNDATHYVLTNVTRMLCNQKQNAANEEIYEELAIEEIYKSEQNSRIFSKNRILTAILLLFVVFLCVIGIKKKKAKDVNFSYMFNGMSRSSFFGGDFDNMKWSYGGKEE